MKNKIFTILVILILTTSCSNDTIAQPIKISEHTNLVNMFTNEPITMNNEIHIINIWASWCLECIQEHQDFIELSKNPELSSKLIFVLFQDNKRNAIEFINKYGKGNILYAIDANSKLAIDLGVFGVPETYIIKNLMIEKKILGPTNLLSLQTELNTISK